MVVLLVVAVVLLVVVLVYFSVLLTSPKRTPVIVRVSPLDVAVRLAG